MNALNTMWTGFLFILALVWGVVLMFQGDFTNGLILVLGAFILKNAFEASNGAMTLSQNDRKVYAKLKVVEAYAAWIKDAICKPDRKGG